MQEKGFVSIYKDLLLRFFKLIFNPKVAWQEVESENVDQDTFLSDYLLPLIGLMAIVLFVVKGVSEPSFSIVGGLKGGAFYFIAIFLTFYIVINLKDTFLGAQFIQPNNNAFLHLVGFSSLFPTFFGGLALLNYYFLPLYAFSLMTIPVFMVGLTLYLQTSGQKKSVVTMLLSLLLLTLPPLFYYLLTIISRV